MGVSIACISADALINVRHGSTTPSRTGNGKKPLHGIVWKARITDRKRNLKRQHGWLQMVQLKDFDMRSDEAVREAISRSNVVVNCLGADKETMNFSYEEVHVEFAERIARACADSEVLERLLHVSCLAASPDAPSRRLTTKVGASQ